MENIIRTIGYGILFACSALMFYFLHSHFFYIVLIVMGVFPFLSLAMGWLLKRRVSVQAECRGERSGRQHEEAYFVIRVLNPTWFASLDAKLCLAVSNPFFRTEGEQIVSIPIHARKGYTLELPIISDYPGIVQIKVKSLRIKDFMGFRFFRQRCDASAELVVMPEQIFNVSYDTVNMEQGMLESEESTKRGNDFSDVQEIREYIPGDKLMSIHWKLSAKRDILMVKDRVSMSDKQLVILPELCADNRAELNMILSAAYTLVHRMLADKTTVRLLYWSANRYEYEDIRIDYPGEADDAFAKMFYETPYSGMEEAASHMASVHPEMKAYLHVTAQNGEIQIRIRENG